jgi:2',3'-cyclic-nucleotide 2'-phosphodiesterase (5'-nucleotidase family)
LHSNDVHSHLENHMRLGHALRARRTQLQQQNKFVLTFDIGDLIDRVRPETEATYGEINAAVMAALGYDGWVFGNNEGLTIPFDRWRQIVDRAECTVFGTNLRQTGDQCVPGFVDWKVYQCGDVRVGVFGLTPKYDKPYEHLKVYALPPMEQAKAAVARLKEQNCDVIVALSHLGIWDDRKLAAAVPGIDVILGGHSHTFMDEPEWVGRTAIFQAGKHALAFGHTIIHFNQETGTVDAVEGHCIRVRPDDPLDQQMLSAYRGYLQDVDAVLEQTVVSLRQPLPVCLTRESPFPNLLADALYAAFPCDLAIMMAGALNASLLPGRITRRHLHAACSTPTRPLLMTLSGRDILSILRTSLQADTARQYGKGYGFRGSLVGYLALSNACARVAVDVDRQPRLVSLQIGGKEVNPDAYYRVATCEYLWLSPLYKEFQRGTDIDIRPPLVREVLAEHLARTESFADARSQRYHVVTER